MSRLPLKAAALALALALALACLAAAQSTKNQQRQQQQQQPRPTPAASRSPPAPKRPQQVQQQLDYGNEQGAGEENSSAAADSEPALYGSVAGQPGVDFPNYQRVPKTSFTCEGKGFDFGFYADEETQCQAYHVCWEGRRESFLCGVGTVFNQAILACDYWHSVDCSKSSQFYGANSELGKAGAEPAAQRQSRQQQQPPPPVPSSSSALAGNQEAPRPSSPAAKPPAASNLNAAANFVPQRSSPTPAAAYDYGGQPARATSLARGQQQETSKAQPPRALQQATTTLAPPPPPTVAAKRRPSFSMDLNQKVHSLIESPVRPPIKSSAPRRQQPAKQQAANFAQAAVSRAQQAGSQTPNGRAAKTSAAGQAQFQFQQPQQLGYEADLEQNEPQQQQQQTFDDSPVQTTQQQQQFNQERLPEAPQLVVRAGGSGDGSSAITSQYDSYNNQPQLQQQQLESGPGYEAPGQQAQQADELGGQNDDFRSAGAKAAASHNQNWYIMRTI